MSQNIGQGWAGTRDERRHGARSGPSGLLPPFYILASFPLAFFCGALVTDLAYLKTANMMWTDFSAWLLGAGLVLGVLAALVGLVLLIVNRRAEWQRPVWPAVVGCVSVLVIGLFNNLVHSRDAWTSVVPTGLTLSAINVAVILITAWYGFGVSARPDSGVR